MGSNQLGDNILAAILALSASEKYDRTKLMRAMGNEIEDWVANVSASILCPTGNIKMHGSNTIPDGYLLCDGSAISRSTYSALFAKIGVIFGPGDGSTTFNLPDFRGIFPRGVGINGTLQDAMGNYFSASLGSYQNDAEQGHKHKQGGIVANSGSSYQYLPWSSYVPDPYPDFEYEPNTVEGNEVLPYTSPNDYTDGSHGTPRVDVETRPANLAVNFIIKI